MDGIQTFGNTGAAQSFQDSLEKKDFLFSLVISYTETAEIPGITFAGSSPEMIQYTPPADAEFIHYGHCKSIDHIPVTPDGKPTPALLTKTALESASIPHVVVNAGSKLNPQLPFIHTGLPYGRSIDRGAAMAESDLLRAIDYGRITGRTLSSLTDCLVIGESVPGGTTTALSVMRGLGIDARVSSSMPENPSELKDRTASGALKRLPSRDPFVVAATLGDPMIPFVAGMLSTASDVSRVMLAGGTQMAAVLAFARSLGFNQRNVAVGTTSYVIRDESADLVQTVSRLADIPVLAVDPGLDASDVPGLRAFSEGFAKEGAGAGGCIISSMLKTGADPARLREKAEKEYGRITGR